MLKVYFIMLSFWTISVHSINSRLTSAAFLGQGYNFYLAVFLDNFCISRLKPGTHHAIFAFCWTQRRRKDDCRMVCAHQRRSSSVDFTNVPVVGQMTQGCRTVCYWYTKYPPGSLSASTVVSRCVCSQLLSRSVCGHSTIVAWCVRLIRQSSSSSPQTTIVGPTKVAWCVPSLTYPAFQDIV